MTQFQSVRYANITRPAAGDGAASKSATQPKILHQPPKFESEGIPFLFVANIIRGAIDFNTEKFISDTTYRELTRRCPIERGDILYSTVGSYGVPVKVDTDRAFSFQRHIAHIKPDQTVVDPDFLVGMLMTPALQAQAHAAARGVAQKTVNLGEIRRYRVIVPPLNEQVVFRARVAALRALEQSQMEAAFLAKHAFQSLLAGFLERGIAYEH